MPKPITAFFAVTCLGLVAATVYARQQGISLTDLASTASHKVQAKANMWFADYAPWKKPVQQTGSLPETAAKAPTAKAADANTADTSLATALTPPSPEETGSAPRIDVSRISPDGTSVFAGTSAPNATITLFADGTPFAEVTADETGSWSILTNHRFANLDPKLTLERGQYLAQHLAKSQPAGTNTGEASADVDHQRVTAAEAKDALKNFEAIVDEARRENDAKDGAATATAQAPGTAPGTPPASGSSATQTATSQTGVIKIPVPITFVYNSAELTDDGAYAARLLVDYVKFKGLKSVSLTGHADERGSDAYNFDLSRDRLEAIEKILRQGGYDGRLQLIAKGASEPYRGVDRNALPREELYQADRRVELKYTR